MLMMLSTEIGRQQTPSSPLASRHSLFSIKSIVAPIQVEGIWQVPSLPPAVKQRDLSTVKADDEDCTDDELPGEDCTVVHSGEQWAQLSLLGIWLPSLSTLVLHQYLLSGSPSFIQPSLTLPPHTNGSTHGFPAPGPDTVLHTLSGWENTTLSLFWQSHDITTVNNNRDPFIMAVTTLLRSLACQAPHIRNLGKTGLVGIPTHSHNVARLTRHSNTHWEC